MTGPGSAIASIATGHEAATSIHRFLSGESLSQGRVYRPVPVYPRYEKASTEGVENSRRRVKLPMAKGSERAKDFRQVELGFTHIEGLAEAARCLRCSSDVCVGCTFCARTCPDYAIRVERVDDPGERCVTRYDLDLSKCCFCGLCAEQCPTDALQHTGQYELSFYSKDLTLFDKDEMVRPGEGSRATGADMPAGAAAGVPCGYGGQLTPDSQPREPRRCAAACRGGALVSGMTGAGLFWLLAAVALIGALAVVFVRDVMRMALGLGAFLLAVAGFFAYYGFGFLALAELFVYVGGVLVLVLFAIMLVHRSGAGAPVLESRVDGLAVVSAAAVSILLFAMLRPLASMFSASLVGR